MRFERVRICGFGAALPPNVVASSELDARLAPLYAALHLPTGQIEALTGVRERRFWNRGQRMSDVAIDAARACLRDAAITAGQVGMLVYGGVCRDYLEPATACAVADALGVGGDAQLYDVSNACLGAVNGMIQVASAIELGQIRAGLVVCAESAREIVDSSIDRMLSRPDMEMFKTTFATMTGGSGAAAILLADEALAGDAHRLIGGVARAAPQHHRLCRWGPEGTPDGREAPPLETHAVDVLENGVDLAIGTWRDFLALTGWRDGPDRTICHQVAAANRDALLKAIRVSPERDFATFPYLGNMGTASLPVTAALAAERGFVQRGDRVGLLGIGSGLNCLMLAVEW